MKTKVVTENKLILMSNERYDFTGNTESANKKEKDKFKLNAMRYSDYLKTNHYLKLARAVKKRDNYTCQICGISKSDNQNILLNAHHTSYDNRGDYEAELNDMVTLCNACHVIEHQLTSTTQYSSCWKCGREFRLLNLIVDNTEILKENNFKEGEFVENCITYKCPFCNTKMWGKIDVYNLQKLFKINNTKYCR